MKISELKDGAMRIGVEAKIIEKGEPREVNTRFGRTRVCDAMIEDDSGTVTLTLWGEQIDSVKEGDMIRVQNGYVRSWQEKLQVNVGKYGKIQVI